jgi:AraC family transcriptional regulator
MSKLEKFNPPILGDYLKRSNVNEFVLVETLHQPASILSKHFHEYASITLTLKGSFVEKNARRSQKCLPYSLLITPAGEVHTNQYSQTGARCLNIKVNPNRAELISSFSGILNHTHYVQESYSSALVKRIYQEFKVMDAASILSIEGLILEMLGQILRQNSREHLGSKPPSWLSVAREIVHERFGEQISLFTIADFVGVHPAHLARLFRKHYRLSVGEYIRRLRLDYALEQLLQSDGKLVEIAQAAGFYDQSHFSHAFKLHSGMTPTEFRKLNHRCKTDTNKR